MTGSDAESAVEIRRIAALVHGRYLLLDGDEGGGGEEGGTHLLVGCHGYAETAARHLEKLRRIPGRERWLLCAVQGLHRFYHPRSGEVLASWMTKEDRELAIDDNVRYLQAVVGELRRERGSIRRMVFAGFSQGVAMAYRAATRCGFPCHGLLALAGDVPPDVAEGVPAMPPVLLGRGRDDAWYTEQKMSQDLQALRRLGADVTECVFDGGHDWTADYYRAAGGFLDRVRESGSA